MKIISGTEPLFCDINDQSYKILTDISSTSTDKELMQRMRHWMPLNFESMVHLTDWKEVLNKIDQRLSTIMNTWRKNIVLVSDDKNEENIEHNADYEVDMKDLKCILLFTSELLKSSINKEVYNSTEYFIELMGAYDDELVALTLDTLLSLALPPLSHRCNLDMTRHITALHRNLPYFDPIFEVIESSFFTCSTPLTEFLSQNFVPTKEMRKVHVNLRTHAKFCKNMIISESNGHTQELDNYSKPENSYEIEDIWENTQDIKDILQNNASALSYGLKFSLMYTIRMKKMLKTIKGRQTILRMLYQATTIVLGCHPDATVLSSYFEDKITLIKNFMYLLRTGPGSLDYTPDLLPLDVRLLACQCLEAIVGSRDSSSTPIFARYPWIVQDLGLNRGQYMGLLPCLVRSMTSYLVALDTPSTSNSNISSSSTGAEESKMDIVTLSHSQESTSSNSNTHTETPEEREARLLWIENVFMLLIAIINIAASLPALTDNGLISAVLLVLERENLYNREGANMYVEIMTVEILEGAVTSHGPAMTAFKEKGGMEIVIDRLHRELVYCLVDCPPPVVTSPMTVVRGSNGTLSVASSILIQEFFSLLTSVLQEDRSHSSDREQWYRLPALSEALRLILANAHIVGSLILSPAISLLAEIINSDPAPPTILSHMLNSGVAKGALRVLTGQSLEEEEESTATSSATAVSSRKPPSQDLIYSSDLMLSMGCLMSSLSLTKDGSELIMAVSSFKTIFGIFYDPRNVYPHSRVIMSDLPNMLGTNLEELARHYPVYATPMLTELVSAMQKIADLAEPYIGIENYQNGKINFTEEFEQVLHFAVAMLLCLEPLLMNKTTIVEFHKLGGFTLLGKFLRMAFGPPKYLLDAFACTIDNTVSCIGYTPIIALVISRCMNRIAEVERKLLFEYILTDLQEVVTTLQSDLKFHSETFKRAESLRSGNSEIQATAIQSAIIPKTLGGNANPFLEGFLDSVTRDPVQDCYVDNMITERLLSYTRVLRGFALVDCLVDAIGIVLNQRVTGGGWEECWTMFTSPERQQLVEQVLIQLYIPTQLEMARARGMFMNSTRDSCVKVHPVYHLLVVAADHVIVKDTPLEDTGKVNKVCKLGRGCTVEAYERKCVGTTNSVLKYRTKLGWISVFKNSNGNNVDPQVLVIRTSQKSTDDSTEEIARNQDIYADAEKRFDFEKFANISAKRGGFLALYHFNHSVKMNLLTLLSKNIFIRESGSVMIPSENCSISSTAAKNVPLLIDCIRSLIPDIPNASPKSEFDLEGLLMGTSNQTVGNSTSNSSGGGTAVSTRGGTGTKRSRFARGNAAAAATTIDASPSVEETSRILKESYFQQDRVPLLDEFPTSQVYIAIRLAELANSLVFEHRRGRLEMNPLLMAHLLYGDYLEKLFYVVGKIFLCSFPDLALETEDKPEHHHLYSGKWFPLKESDLDQDFIEPTAATTSSTEEPLDTSMQVDNTTADTTQQSSKPSKGKGKAKKSSKDSKEKATSEAKKETAEAAVFTPFPSYLTYRRALRERRLLAISSIDNTLNLWKLLCSAMSPSVTSAERALQRDSTEERDYDPYAMRRLILTTMSKYLVQVWSHSQLHLLPPTTVKNVVDLMAVVIKALHDMKNVGSLRAPPPTTSSSTSGGSSSSAGAEAQRFLNRIGGARRIASAESRHPSGTVSSAATAAVNEFVVTEDCIRTLEEMGFTRRAITRAATVLRSNNANHLVPHLLENPYYFNEPEPTASARASTAATGATASTTTTMVPGESTTAPSATTTEGTETGAVAAPIEAADIASGSAAGLARASTLDTGRTFPSDLNRRLDLLNQLFGLSADLPLPSSSRTAPTGRERKNSHSGGSTAAVEVKSNTLPLIQKQLDVTLKLERDLLQRILKCIYGDVPPLCVKLIEQGPTKLLCLLDNDMKASSVGVTRELFTVMILNQMLKCLEKNMLPEGLLRIVQLSWMYRRAIALLKEGPIAAESFNTLYGLLHAILVLLTSKVNSGNNRQPVGNNELLFLIFTLDDRYNQLYPLLIETLEKFSAEAESSSDGLSTVEKVRLDWIAPALLILDLAAQPILVDSDSLQSHITDIDGYVKYEGQAAVLGETTSTNTKPSSSPDTSILSEQVRQLIRKTFLSKKSALASHSSLDDMLFNMTNARKAGRSFDGIFDLPLNSHTEKPETSTTTPSHKGRGKNKNNTTTATSTNTTTSNTTTMIDNSKDNSMKDNEKNESMDKLPLFENSISEDLKMRGLKVSITLLKLITRIKTDDTTILPQAILQFLVHLIRFPQLRKEFYEFNGGILILQCKHSFDGMANIIFTLLQQILEDERSLLQSMITAVRLCLMRLSQRKAKNVPLKNFMEVICPVVFRQQALFMKVLKEHTILKSSSGTVYITWKDIPVVPAAAVESKMITAGDETPAVTALVRQTSTDSTKATTSTGSAAKRQRLQDGSAAVTSKTPLPATTTAGAASATTPASGLKSGAKRVVTQISTTEGGATTTTPSGTGATSSSAVKVASYSSILHNEAIPVVMDELLSRIVCKWLQIRTMDQTGATKLTIDKDAVDTSLSIAEMLIIAADLIAAQPAVSVYVLRYCFNVAKVPVWAKEIAKTEFPLKHVLTGQALGGLFVTFVVHALLMPAKLVSFDTTTSSSVPGLSTEAAAKQVEERNAALNKLTGTGLRNACSYFLASLASRPGDSRKRVLNEVLQGANVGNTVINRSTLMRSLVAFAETLQYLLSPPPQWVTRDAFIVPAKDILSTITKLGAHTRLSAAICALDMTHPLALETVMVLSVPLDNIIKKGLEPTPATPAAAITDATKTIPSTGEGATRERPRASSSSGGNTQESTALPEPAAATAPSTSSGLPPRPSGSTSRTPNHRRTSTGNASSTAATSSVPDTAGRSSRANSAGDASRAFTTPALNRRRGNTDQSLDTEERMLLLGDQHEHLIHPADYRHHDEDSEGGYDQDEIDGDAAVQEYMDAEGIGGGGDDYDDDDDDEDPGSDDDDDEDGDEDESDEDGPGHHHHHAMGHDDSGSDSEGEDDSHGMHSHSDGEHSRDDDDEDDMDESDDDDDIDDSRDYPIDEDDDEEEDEDDEAMEQPELEIDVEIEEDSQAEEQHNHEDEEGEGVEELDEFDPDDDESIDSDQADPEDEMDEDDEEEEGEEGEHQIEPEDEEGENGAGMENIFDDDQDMEFAHEGEEDMEEEDQYDNLAYNAHQEDDEADADADEDGAGLGDEDNFWAQEGRIPTTGLRSRIAEHADDGDDDFMNAASRPRGHDRSRRVSINAAGGMAHPLDLGALIRDVQNRGGSRSGVFRLPPGSVLAGGVLETQNEDGPGETISFGQDGGAASRNMWTRNNEDGGVGMQLSDMLSGGNGLASFSANFQDFVQNMLPPNMSMTSSTARVDPRTGALTLSFGGTRNADGVVTNTISGGGGNSSNSNALGATAIQPPAHPLLTVTDARRNRFLQPCVNGLAVAIGGSRQTSLTQRMAGLSALTGGSSSTLDASNRRGQLSVRRREVGPIVSDRRWGTDVGDLEPAGARLAALTTAVESALSDVIEKEPLPESRSRSTSLAAKSSSSHGRSRSKSADRDDWLAGLSSLFPGSMASDDEAASPPALGGVHHETDEGEGNDSEGSEHGSDDAEARNAARRRRFGFDPSESKEDEGELQESKEDEPSPSRNQTASTVNTSSSSSTQSPPAASSEAPTGSAPSTETPASAMDVEAAASDDANTSAAITTTTVEATTSDTMEVVDASAPSTATATAPSAEPALSEENVQFLDSLTPELRQEVLLTAENEFLQSLSAAIQQEAHALRVEMGMEEPSDIVPTTTTAAATTSSTAAPAIDFASIMENLQPSSTGTSAAPTTARDATSAQVPSSGNSSSNEAARLLQMLESTIAAPAPVPGNDTGTATGSSSSSIVVPLFSRASDQSATAGAAQSSTGRAATAVASRKTADFTTIALGDDRNDDTLPYGPHLIARLLRSFITVNRSKLPRSLSKLIATACRYKNGRLWILRALLGCLTHDGQRVSYCLRKLPLETESAPAAFDSELTELEYAVQRMPQRQVNVHKIITGLSFLLRRTDRLAWYDFMLRPEPEEDSVWLFGSLIELLGDNVLSSGENLEHVLQILEELCGVFSKLTVKQANELAAESQKRLDATRKLNGKGLSVTYAPTTAALETIAEEGDEEPASALKRRRLEPATPDPSAVSPSRARAASIDIQAAAAETVSTTTARDAESRSAIDPATSQAAVGAATGAKGRCRIPFPVLQETEAKLLCKIAGSVNCNGNARKRLMRVMRYLSLCDSNWMLFLDQMAHVGAELASRATLEFSDLHNTLVEVAQHNESAATAMARPELSTPKSLSEVRLLNVLRIMSALRSRSSDSAAAESEVVASRMRRIQAGKLWDTLCDCLDIVRDLEGIVEIEEVEPPVTKKNNSAHGHMHKMEEDKKVALSSLTMRFMPLIECFLSVCATTMLVRPDSSSAHHAMNEAQKELERMSSGFKRRHSRDEAPPSASRSNTINDPTSSSTGIAGRLSPMTPATGTGHHDLVSPASITKVNSMLPGSRFRQHASYFQMQMELTDETAAQRLITFVKQNRVLFNNVLRNNVSLLEASFSPLVNVPKCRQLLHFDIKRAYFKLKLKRMRQSAARSHGALRLSVRRSGVFEESFQALRYKTADEMRRRLSVNFHGEEGMDAGGLTREWYGVLAREIFNPNYALFTSAGDNVTFQPNAQSYINPDHQSYFKFVGRVIGKAICDGQLLDAHFTRSFYKHILGLPVSVVDLEAIDPEYFKSLKQILNTPLDLLGLDLTFSAESNDFGVVSTVDLIPQGRDVEVTDDTKHEYVKLLAHHRMTTAIRKQIDSFLEGFHELVPSELVSIFDAQELELLISGLPDIDLDDLRAYTDYQGYKPTDPQMTHFWSVLKAFSTEEKALFLQFVTGTSKVPLDGFKALQGSDGVKHFNIQKAFGGSHLLPSAHTCFNQLDLPEYPSEEVLREKLLIAIREGSEGFGFA